MSGVRVPPRHQVKEALAPYVRRLSDPEPLVYSVREAAHVLATSTNTVRRLIDEGVLSIVPHMGQRIVIPRIAVAQLVQADKSPREEDTAAGARLLRRAASVS